MYTSCCLHSDSSGVPVAFYYTSIESHSRFSRRYNVQLGSWVWDALKASVLHKEVIDEATTWELQYGILHLKNTGDSFSIPYADARRLLTLQHNAFKLGQLYRFCYYADTPALGIRKQDGFYYVIDYATLEVIELKSCALVTHLLNLVDKSIDYAKYTSILRQYFR